MPNRLRPVTAATADPDQADAIRAFLAHRQGVETSPANLYGMLYTSAGAGHVLSEVGAFCRFRNSVPKPALEAAILTTLHTLGFQYEVGPHEEYARTLGLDGATLLALRGGTTTDLAPDLALAATVARALLERTPVPQPVFEEARASWGPQGVVDLTVTVGYYSLLAMASRMFTPELDRSSLLPPTP